MMMFGPLPDTPETWINGAADHAESAASQARIALTKVRQWLGERDTRIQTLQTENAELRRKLNGPPAEWVMDEPDTQDEAIRIACLMADAYAARSPDEPISERRVRAAAVWRRENGLTPAASEDTP